MINKTFIILNTILDLTYLVDIYTILKGRGLNITLIRRLYLAYNHLHLT